MQHLLHAIKKFGRKICSNKIFVAWNKWVVIALEISFPRYCISYHTKLAAGVTGGKWGDAQANTL